MVVELAERVDSEKSGLVGSAEDGVPPLELAEAELLSGSSNTGVSSVNTGWPEPAPSLRAASLLDVVEPLLAVPVVLILPIFCDEFWLLDVEPEGDEGKLPVGVDAPARPEELDDEFLDVELLDVELDDDDLDEALDDELLLEDVLDDDDEEELLELFSSLQAVSANISSGISIFSFIIRMSVSL